MVYRLIARPLPRATIRFFEKLIVYADIEYDVEKFLGFVIVNSFLASIFLSFVLASAIKLPFYLFFFSFLVFLPFAFCMYLVFSADKRSKFIETVLPDALQMMSSNLRAGFTTDKALLLSARSEFGPLSKEINRVGTEITTGNDIEQSMLDSTKRVKSSIYERTMKLIVSGLKSGGRLSDLLEQTAKDLKEQQAVSKKVGTSVNMYVIFMFFAVGFGSPLVMSLVSVLLEVLIKGFSLLSLPQQSNFPLLISGIDINPSFIITFTVINLITTAIIGSLVIGLISKGKEREGIKYIPLLLAVSLGLFFAVRFVATKILGSLFAAM